MRKNPEGQPGHPLPPVDHLIYGVPDLEQGIDHLEHLLGVRAVIGGQHPGEGTHNALIGLGERCYLEIMAPDPRQPAPDRPRWLGLDAIRGARLVAWAVKGENLPQRWEAARQAGLTLGEVRSGSRARPDGSVISWTFTDPHIVLGDGLVPFLIDWGASPHPAGQAPGGVRLVDLRSEHPQPERIRSMLQILAVDLPVTTGPQPALIATLETAGGRVEIR